jgi:4-amino-4-deoxy-L-arabinose transferase-like glycosyltransferase
MRSGSRTAVVAALGDLSPQTVLAIFVCAQIVIWTAVPRLLAISLPLDVVSDGLGWGHEWQWGYYKHPPLPSWEVEAFFDLFGDTGPFLLSQLAIGATYVFVFLIGKEMMPARQALAGTLLLTGTYYFSIPTPEFNHNVAQMPVWAAASFAYCKVLKTGRLRWWAALGLAAGIAILTKYASVVLLGAMLAHLLSTRKTAAAFAAGGPYLALAVLFAVISPHLVWLVQNHFPTLGYAEARAGHSAGSLSRITAPFRFLLSQAVAVLPCLVIAAAIGLVRLAPLRHLPPLANENFRFLVFLGVGPALIAALVSLATGYGMRDMWGMPMWNLTGLLIVCFMAERFEKASMTSLYACVAALFVLLPFAYALSTSIVPELKGKPSRTEWPDRALARDFSQAWSAATGRPVAIVAGDGWLAGLIAMRLSPRPSVFTDADMRHAPWITPGRLARDGALVVWRAHGTDAPPPGLYLPGMNVMGVKLFAWPREPKTEPLRIGWGILSPASGQAR